MVQRIEEPKQLQTSVPFSRQHLRQWAYHKKIGKKSFQPVSLTLVASKFPNEISANGRKYISYSN
jgi:hypothetical protein